MRSGAPHFCKFQTIVSTTPPGDGREYEPEMRLGLPGSMRVVPSEVSECPSRFVSVSGIVKFLPSFGVHCPLKVELVEPPTLPFICGTPTLTLYVPSLLTPTFTLASTVSLPLMSVRDVDVPRMSWKLLPRSHELLSTPSTFSTEDIVWLIVARPRLVPFFSGASITAT
jgi:hypothetical protein